MCDLVAKVKFLASPPAYPDPVRSVEVIETHMSYVFLTDCHAYKLKKPIRYEALDFRHMDSRRYYCEEEVRLNRRLAPDVYLGVVPLGVNTGGMLCLGEGHPVDWLVKMRRLRAFDGLDRRIAQGTVSATEIAGVARLLAGFYRTCAAGMRRPATCMRHLAVVIARNEEALCRSDMRDLSPAIRHVAAMQRDACRTLAPQLDERVLAGKVVEGHGDLRPAHVYLEPSPVVIDSLEFSRRLRVADWADEVGYLALECDVLGATEVGEHILASTLDLLADPVPPGLIRFYQSLRASTRARITIRHLDEDKYRATPHWRRLAEDYLRLAGQKITQAG